MRAFILAAAALLQTSAALPFSCATSGTACNGLKSTEIVFMGKVIEDSGRGFGKGPGRMIVEEVFHGLAKDVREVIVDTGAGFSCCYMRLQKGERYVIYGTREDSGRIRRNSCSFSFAVTGNEALLSAIRDAESGGTARLVGKVELKC